MCASFKKLLLRKNKIYEIILKLINTSDLYKYVGVFRHVPIIATYSKYSIYRCLNFYLLNLFIKKNFHNIHYLKIKSRLFSILKLEIEFPIIVVSDTVIFASLKEK